MPYRRPDGTVDKDLCYLSGYGGKVSCPFNCSRFCARMAGRRWSGGFTPMQLSPAPTAWFQYGQGITVATGVSQWNDQSGNGRHLTQATAGSQPAKQADGSILFDGVDDQLSNNAFTLSQPCTIYLLYKIITWASNTQIFNSASVGNTLLNMQGSAGAVTARMNAGTNLDQTTGPVVGSYSVAACVFNGASSVNEVNTQTPLIGDAGANTFNGFSLAASITPNLWSNIQVKEAILYAAAHDAWTRNMVISYLAGK